MGNKFDVAIIGAGVLGVTIAYWLSSLSNCSIALIDKESAVAKHTSSRNTGVIHRPFYLNPDKKRIFARAAQKSYFLWSDLAEKYHLLWLEVGTLEVAIQESQLETLVQYQNWAAKNGMDESEIEVLDFEEVRKIEPLVYCAGAIHSKKDTAVKYGDLTNCVFELAQKNDVEFIGASELIHVEDGSSGVSLTLQNKSGLISRVPCSFMINAAGGSSIDVAHMLGLARQYTDLHFRGEYWFVEDSFGKSISRNVYSVPRHKDFPFLDPHFIVRADGQREVGPNAVLVSGPNAYRGFSTSKSELLKKIFEGPNYPKLKLFTNSQFLSLVWQEWRSSLSKKQMCERVKKFIPSLEVSKLHTRGLSGVRNSVIDEHGFVPEAITVLGKHSLHILNYNSPGATGAPAYSAYVVKKIFEGGFIQRKNQATEISTELSWNFDTGSDL
ncbi:MAG TPA: FAD-dependent oxidoreductase [Nitrososphaerales archaeon]|nr:FAD-dependent oxidoreductase [Nitrososphaerales archaeon]